MDLSGPEGSSERGVTPPHPPFTTILNLPFSSLPSFLPPSSSLLTPPAVSPGNKSHANHHHCAPSKIVKRDDSVSLGYPKTSSGPTVRSTVDHASTVTSTSGVSGKKHLADASSQQSGYIDLLKSLISEENLKANEPFGQSNTASSVPSYWPPTGANLHDGPSVFAPILPAHVPLLSSQRFTPSQFLLASASHAPPPPPPPPHPPPRKEVGPASSLLTTTVVDMMPRNKGRFDPAVGDMRDSEMRHSEMRHYRKKDITGDPPYSNNLLSTIQSSLTMKEERSCLPPSGLLPISKLRDDLNVVVPEETIMPPLAPEEEGIDVCNFKEPFHLKKVPQSDQLFQEGHKGSLTDEESEQEPDPPLPTFSHLGSECSRTVPSLMKCYSRHKRFLSDSLSVSLSVSGQATPPSSPISPGTFPRPSLASYDKAPTPKSEESHPDSIVNSSSKSKHSSPVASLTLLTIPKVAPPLSVTSSSSSSSILPYREISPKKQPLPYSPNERLPPYNSHCAESNCIRNKPQNHHQPLLRTCIGEHSGSGSIVTSSPMVSTTSSSLLVPSLLPPVTSSGVMHGAMPLNPFANPWPLPHNPCPPTGIPPAPFWISQGVDANVAARIGLGYQLASDPLTGHLLLVPRAHPLSDPSGHGIVWTGYGAPQVVMTPQQLLLGDAHFRHSLHAPHSLLHLPHHQAPSIHSPVKKDTSSPSPITKDDVKKAPSNSLEGTSPSTDFPLPPGISPANLPPHFLYPPTSLPYYFPQPSHPTPYDLASFNHCSTTLSLSNNLISSLATHITSSTTSLTTTKSLANALVSTTYSRTHTPTAPTLTTWSGSSNKATSPLNFCQAPLCHSFESTHLYSEPPIDLTHRPKTPLKENHPLPPSQPSLQPLSQRLGPLSVCTTSNLQGYNISKQTTTTLIIKKEIKEEVLSPNCVVNDDTSTSDPTSIKSLVKKESDSHFNKSRCSCKAQVKDKALQVSSDVDESMLEYGGLIDASSIVPYSKEQQSEHDSSSIFLEKSSVSTSPPLPRSPSFDLDISGLELLSHSILEHADRLHSPVSLTQQADYDIETSSTHSDAMPLLEPAIYTPSPRSSPTSFDNLPPVLSPPVPLSSLISSSPKKDDGPPSLSSETTTLLPPSCKVLHGLSLLCALAEQRILEEEQKSGSALSSLAEVASTQTEDLPNLEEGSACTREDGVFRDDASPTCESDSPGPSRKPRSHSNVSDEGIFCENISESPEVDINRNYKSPQSQHEVIAYPSKASQCPQTDDEELVDSSPHYRKEYSLPSDADSKNKLITMEEKHKDTPLSLSILPSNERCSSLLPKRKPGRPPKKKKQVDQQKSKLDSWKDIEDPTKRETLDGCSLLLKMRNESLLPFEDPNSIIRDKAKSPHMSLEAEHGHLEEKNPSLFKEKPRIKIEETFSRSSSLDEGDMRSSSFKLPICSSDSKHEYSEDEQRKEPLSNDVSDRESKGSIAEMSVESSLSDAELPSILVSSSKKRKPGRPKKHSPSKEEEATETIVAKKSKSLSFLLLSRSHKPKMRPKLKAELKVRYSDEDDEAVGDMLGCSYDAKSKEDNNLILPQRASSVGQTGRSSKKLVFKRRGGSGRGRTSLTRRVMLRDKEKRKSAIERQSHMEALFRSLKRHSAMAAAEHDESEDEKEDDKTNIECFEVKKETCSSSPIHETSEEQRDVNPSLLTNGLHLEEKEDPAIVANAQHGGGPSSDAVTQPGLEEAPRVKEEARGPVDVNDGGSISRTQPKVEESSVCKMQIEDLISHARVLILQDGLLYAGTLSPITPPDVYGVHVDGERSTRPHIYCQEDLLTQAWKEVKPGSIRFLAEGTRVCAFWSQQYRGLYPGSVAAASSPSQEGNHNFVNVEFDDGDSGRIHVDDVRLLPQDFPIIEYDPNPLLTLNKRKRRPTEDTIDHDSKGGTGREPLSKKSKKAPKAVKEEVDDVPDEQEADDNAILSSEGDDDEEEDSSLMKKNSNKKKHKKRRHSDHHKHKHKHRHKHKHKHQRPLPHVEPVDGGELRFRIKSPPPMSEDRRTSYEAELDNQEVVTSSGEELEEQADKSKKVKHAKPGRRKKRRTSEKSKIAPFLLERRLWRWSGKGFKRPGAKGKGKKEFFKEIIRGKEQIRVGDCAVFLSTGQPDRPYIGRIESLWESWGGNMVVKVKWFYHPEETKGLGKRLAEPKGALFQSPHMDENDVQTISHKCAVIQLSDYKVKRAELELKNGPEYENFDLYYLAGFYDPIYGRITMEPGVS